MKTFVQTPRQTYPVHGGTTHSDVFGPVTLDSLQDLPTISADEKKSYYGRRFCLAGGAVPQDEIDAAEAEGEGDDLDEAEPHEDDTEAAPQTSDGKVPISYHTLPISVITDLVAGFDIKHIIDLGPSPLNLGFEFARRGCSYVALCATSVQKEYLQERAFTALRAAIADPTEKLIFDARFQGICQYKF